MMENSERHSVSIYQRLSEAVGNALEIVDELEKLSPSLEREDIRDLLDEAAALCDPYPAKTILVHCPVCTKKTVLVTQDRDGLQARCGNKCAASKVAKGLGLRPPKKDAICGPWGGAA